MFLVVLSRLAMFPLVTRAQDDVDVCKIENCDTVENQLPITTMEGAVNLKGCPGDLIKLKFSPKKEVGCDHVLMIHTF